MGEGGAVVTDPAEARKRRKAILTSQRQETEGNPSPVGVEHAAIAATVACVPAANPNAPEEAPKESQKSSSSVEPNSKKQKSDMSADTSDNSHLSNGKKKTQIRYDPEEPMSKESLAAWRREARRVRNRESAAASRQRIRSRITELEDEVEEWKTKYNEAVSRLATISHPSPAAVVPAQNELKSKSNDTNSPKA